MRSWLSRSSAATHVTVAVSGLTRKDQLPCAAGAAVRGQANEPGDLQNRRASVRELLEASPSASSEAYKKVASYACMPRAGEAWTEAGMHACPASPSHSSGTSGGAVQQGEHVRTHSLVCSCWNVCSEAHGEGAGSARRPRYIAVSGLMQPGKLPCAVG